MEAFRVTQAIMDEYCARILLGTFDHPVSAIELGRRFGIPIAACYRRIKELEVMGLVYCERAEPSRNGRGLQLYRSCLRSVRIAFDEGKLHARVELGSAGIVVDNEISVHVVSLVGPSLTASLVAPQR